MRRFHCLLPLAVVLLLSRAVPAEVIDYQQLIQSHANLLHQYTFDGDATERLQDQQGSADLVEVSRGSSGFDPVTFIPGFAVPGGFAPTSTAVLTTRHGSTQHWGAGLSTPDANSADYLSLPSTLTVEALFRPDEAWLPTGTNNAYIVSFRPASNRRGYFVMQRQATAGEASRLVTNIGNGFGGGNELQLLSSLTPGNWYYTATTFDVDEGNNTTTVTGYIADLTAGDTELTPLGSETVSGSYLGDAPLAIGVLNNKAYAGDYEHFFPGAIDEVALYDGVLDQATLQSHLTAIMVPEPSTVGLLAFGLLAVLAFHRRNRP